MAYHCQYRSVSVTGQNPWAGGTPLLFFAAGRLLVSSDLKLEKT
jgi:hypothetical protein